MPIAMVPVSVDCRVVKLLIVVVALTLLYAGGALGQETTGTLEGKLLGLDGQPVANVHVTVEGSSLLAARTTLSSEKGFFRIPALPVGDYVVHFQHTGSRDLTITDVRIRLGQTTPLGELTFSDGTGGVETIVVTATRMVDPVSTELGANLDAELLELLPIERDYREAIAYLPQANASFYGDPANIAGSTGIENGFYIDGVHASESFFGIDSTRLPQNFVQEIEVKTGGFAAEFGRSSGGIINVVTKSGSNEFQTEAFGYLSNDNFAKDRRLGTFDLNRGDYNRYDIGLSLSGPIVRDKLWYFAAYDPTFESDKLEVPGLGVYEDKLVRHIFATKLDWQATSDTRLSFLGFGDPTRHDLLGVFGFTNTSPLASGLGNIDPWLRKVERGGYSLSLNAQHLVGDRAVLDASLSRTIGGYRIGSATQRGKDEPFFLDLNTNFVSGGTGLGSDRVWESFRHTAALRSTIHAEQHHLKIGLEYQLIATDAIFDLYTTDGRPGQIWLHTNGVYQQIGIHQDQQVRHRIPTAFVQDSWQVADRLRINVGIRWDGLQLVSPSDDVVVEINDQLQPRAGFVYQFGHAGSQKVFGSYGRFYEQLTTAPTTVGFGEGVRVDLITQEDPRQNPNAVADTTTTVFSSADPIEGLSGPHHDEFILGYERRVGETWRTQVRGIYRNLREALENSLFDGSQYNPVWGNPGKGALSYLPRPKREYSGVELSVEKSRPGRYQVGTSYVLSRTYGNYPGAFPSESTSFPHLTSSFDVPEVFDIEGYLPQDRTHVFKLFGGYRTDFGLTTGGFFSWQTGTPRTPQGGVLSRTTRMFAGDRGSLGRTRSIWDINLRFAYDLPGRGAQGRPIQFRLLLDVFHLFSQREPVVYDNYIGDLNVQTGELIPNTVNPSFNEPIAFQPPMTLRLGLESTF